MGDDVGAEESGLCLEWRLRLSVALSVDDGRFTIEGSLLFTEVVAEGTTIRGDASRPILDPGRLESRAEDARLALDMDREEGPEVAMAMAAPLRLMLAASASEARSGRRFASRSFFSLE